MKILFQDFKTERWDSKDRADVPFNTLHASFKYNSMNLEETSVFLKEQTILGLHELLCNANFVQIVARQYCTVFFKFH